jgi:hypothetical protein
MMAPQEMLDFLAVRAGIKPVFLVGRGFDDAQWIGGAVAIAQKAGMQVTEGPFWDTQVEDRTLPGWFREHFRANKPRGNGVYITKAPGPFLRNPGRDRMSLSGRDVGLAHLNWW